MANNTIGTFISPTQAASYLLAFFNDNGLNPDDPTVVSGHILGLTKIKEFLQKIEDYNAANPALPIDGVRTYQARSVQMINGGPQTVDDIFLIPILTDGTDLYPVYPGTTAARADTTDGNDGILGNSRPCPNLCGGGA
ncbi:hypothetical protein [Xanthocytophaga agilis]|uniref:Uncharacterized protein n=1 Tax=Xanthocytophaga agilis TaxID=3048010 RepID=A0AAE3R1Z2_9BACT|nr:hypothetical protein [Xanthocytophaga agilis]MDJ1499854.1 hypothetical protein [Xanthocytophaga agilis]